MRDLGTFLEFEAVVEPEADEAISLQRLEELSRAMGIEAWDRIAVGYSDLLGL